MAERANLLLVDDDDVYRSVLGRELSRRGHTVVSAVDGAKALEAIARATPDVTLLDLRLPDMSGLDVLKAIRAQNVRTEVIVITGHGAIDTAIEAIRLGAFDYVSKPCPLDELEMRISLALERRNLAERNRILEGGLTPPDLTSAFVGQSEWYHGMVRQIGRFAPTESSVLILGETGTGKDVLAKLLHGGSARRDRPFVVVDCASLHESLLQSELFGHERGAFTGALRAKHGLFEVADHGTIFLDEVGDMSPPTQAKLLRVLETSSFRRLGGTAEIKVDVRIIAATNRDLSTLTKQGQFREDLYYRLSTIRLELEPLRNRPADVSVIAQHYVDRHNARFGTSLSLSDQTVEALSRHTWPGNVRELLHAVEQALIVTDGSVVQPQHLPPPIAVRSSQSPCAGIADQDLCSLEEVERVHIDKVLQAMNGHRGRAARVLGVSERNLYRLIRHHRLG